MSVLLQRPEPARVVTADPPWGFDDPLPGKKRGAAKHYKTMTVEEIKAFRLPPLAKDSVLLLWRVAAMVEEAYAVCRAWQFVPKSELIWVKTTQLDDPAHLAFGMGRHTRNCHEVCIIAQRGKNIRRPESKSVRSVFYAPVQEHSRKPERFFDIVERLYPGPYQEMFARRQRPNWRCSGLELDLPVNAP